MWNSHYYILLENLKYFRKYQVPIINEGYFTIEYLFHNSFGNDIPIPFKGVRSCKEIFQVAFPQQLWECNLPTSFPTTNVGS